MSSRAPGRKSRRRQPGFTLVEVLVALSVSALVATLAYQSLSTAADAAAHSEAVAEQVDNVDRVWQLLERDLRQASPLPEATGTATTEAAVVYGGEYPAFLGTGTDDNTQYANQGFVLRFRRGGWLNPLAQERSHLQGVGYRLQEGKLYRFHWPVLNSAPLEEEFIQSQEAFQLPLLEGVESMTLRFLPADAEEINAWIDQWPAQSDTTAANRTLPLAVEITLSVSEFGDSRRVFLLAVDA